MSGFGYGDPGNGERRVCPESGRATWPEFIQDNIDDFPEAERCNGKVMPFQPKAMARQG